MNRKYFYRLAAGCIASILACVGSVDAASPAPTSRPNVIVIVSDDLGYNDLSVQGSKDIPTPHIDSIAQHGSRFTNAYVTGPLCGPSRAGLMSGRYQQRHSSDFMPGPDEGLSLHEATMGDAFHRAGYATAAIGKWNLGTKAQFRPLQRGFDQFFGFLGALHPYIPGPVPASAVMVVEHPRLGWGIPADDLNYDAPSTAPSSLATTAASTASTTSTTKSTTKPTIGGKAGLLVRNDSEVPEKTYLTEAFTREAVGFIDQHASSPYFLYLAYNASHSPLEPPKKYLDRFPTLSGKRQAYAATTSALDNGVGEVLDEVHRLGQDNNTIVVFVNDNGGPIVDTAASNAPLSGTKGTLWEGGIRVALMMQWMGTLQENVPRVQMASALDIFPTVLAAANVPVPPGKTLDGVNLLPLLTGQPQETLDSRILYWRFGGQWAIRQGDWKLVLPEHGSPKSLLFNLQNDVAEDHDIAANHPDVIKRLKSLWDDWDSQNLPLPSGYKRGQAHGDPKPERPQDLDLFRDDDT